MERTVTGLLETVGFGLSEMGKWEGLQRLFSSERANGIHQPPLSLSMPRADKTNWSWYSFPLSLEAASETHKIRLQAATFCWSSLAIAETGKSRPTEQQWLVQGHTVSWWQRTAKVQPVLFYLIPLFSVQEWVSELALISAHIKRSVIWCVSPLITFSDLYYF